MKPSKLTVDVKGTVTNEMNKPFGKYFIFSFNRLIIFFFYSITDGGTATLVCKSLSRSLTITATTDNHGKFECK